MPNLPAKIALFNEINLALKEKKMPNFLNKISLLNVMDFFCEKYSVHYLPKYPNNQTPL